MPKQTSLSLIIFLNMVVYVATTNEFESAFEITVGDKSSKKIFLKDR